jgi:hypothetical protein
VQHSVDRFFSGDRGFKSFPIMLLAVSLQLGGNSIHVDKNVTLGMLDLPGFSKSNHSSVTYRQ